MSLLITSNPFSFLAARTDRGAALIELFVVIVKIGHIALSVSKIYTIIVIK